MKLLYGLITVAAIGGCENYARQMAEKRLITSSQECVAALGEESSEITDFLTRHELVNLLYIKVADYLEKSADYFEKSVQESTSPRREENLVKSKRWGEISEKYAERAKAAGNAGSIDEAMNGLYDKYVTLTRDARVAFDAGRYENGIKFYDDGGFILDAIRTGRETQKKASQDRVGELNRCLASLGINER